MNEVWCLVGATEGLSMLGRLARRFGLGSRLLIDARSPRAVERLEFLVRHDRAEGMMASALGRGDRPHPVLAGHFAVGCNVSEVNPDGTAILEVVYERRIPEVSGWEVEPGSSPFAGYRGLTS